MQKIMNKPSHILEYSAEVFIKYKKSDIKIKVKNKYLISFLNAAKISKLKKKFFLKYIETKK